MATEIEMKLAFESGFSDAQVEALMAVLNDLKCPVALKEKHLENQYFDTPDFQLNKHKVALRIRQKTNDEGKLVYIQTFKTAGTSTGGLSQRGEWEWFLSDKCLDVNVLKANSSWPSLVRPEELVIVFETNFTRYSADIFWNESQIELVLDWGLILSNGKQEVIHEIELELKQGSEEDIRSMSKALKNRLPVDVLDISKAERGVKLFQS